MAAPPAGAIATPPGNGPAGGSAGAAGLTPPGPGTSSACRP
ncbi:hypothetical protein FHS29_000783 [Saccharothrix tamanrassetensis]|uniref:Uncharacterized protein n=1 Tax=Saccharothrix tamanrassetensis TaxID=1051531 RepID=A0A841CB89_9PSEU|nr:hypothetical protein [Saccharothrix tamanrassetensis]MBB5954213.1 hypothetical protein [Saccharothrix tamanrassetensis]